MLDLLGRNPQFLSVHDLERWDVVFLALVLCYGPALVFWAMIRVAGCINRKSSNVVLAGAAIVLLTVVLVPFIDRLVRVPAGVVLVAGVAIASLVTWKPGANPKLRRYWNLLGLISPVVIGLFIFQTGPRSIVFPPPAPAATNPANQAQVQADIPIVLVIFDAFPTVSLMDNEREIDASLCPNLAGFTEDAVWYRNALSLSDDTLKAVPAILTGRLPQPGAQSTSTWYPHNIFTWLAPWRRMYTHESHTRLSDSTPRPGIVERWELAATDLAIVFLHTVLPRGMTGDLPSISHDWIGFAGTTSAGDQSAAHTDRSGLFDDFLESLDTGDRNGCYFLHSIFPHTPYQYLPSGRRYTVGGKEPGGQGMQWGKWRPDPRAVLHSRQRHLLQVGYTDNLVGRILAKLKATGIYDNALVVFTADHGMSFTPGDTRRKLSSTNRGDILPVPLFIKYPGTGGGFVDDRVVQTVDILPTVASVLGTTLSWPVEGRDLLSPNYGGRETLYLARSSADQPEVEIEVGGILENRDASLLVKERQFRRVEGRLELAADDRGWDLVGETIPTVLPSMPSWSISLSGESRRVIPDSLDAMVPAEVFGFVSGDEVFPDDLDILITLDNRIVAVTRPFAVTNKRQAAVWSTLITDRFLDPGTHELGMALVAWNDHRPAFYSLATKELSIYGANLIPDGMLVSKVSGLYGIEDWNGKPAGWTNGAADFRVLIPGTDKPEALALSVEGADPDGAYMAVCANGLLVAAGNLQDLPWSGLVDLSGTIFRDELRLSIFSTTYVPAEFNPASSDKRDLGLAISRVEFQEHLPSDSGAGLPVMPRPFSVALDPGNPGATRWAGVKEAGKWGGHPATWTDGNATCEFTWHHSRRPRFLLVDIAGASPLGSEVIIAVNGIEVAAQGNVHND